MNKLTQFLVDSILNEDNDNLGVVALFGGGFKPPTRGHLEVVLQGLKENPEVKQIYILVGSGERNGVTQEEAIKIWEMYQKFIPVSSQIIPVQSPFSYIKTYLQDHQDEKVYIFIGARPDNEEDDKDVAERSAFAKKYSENAMPVRVQTKGGVSGTMARKAALSGNNKEFITYFPSQLTDKEKQEIIDMVSSVVKEGDTIEKYSAKGKKTGKLKQGTVRKRLNIPKDEKIPMYKINKELSRLKKMDKDKDKKGVQLGDKNQKYYKALQLAKTLKSTTHVNENASYSSEIDILQKIDQLTQHMIDKGMNIEPLPGLKFVNGDTENARDFFGKTAYYDPNTQTIVLYTEGRHPKDIVRSYAHEMIHHIQNLEGRLGNITTTNTQEDDALNDIEAEANLKGTMTFRNWTDSLNEVGDASQKPYNWNRTVSVDPHDGLIEGVDYRFTTDLDTNYVAFFQMVNLMEYEFGFNIPGGSLSQVSNKGELFRVMATMVAIMKDFMDLMGNDWSEILFSGSKDPSRSEDNRRDKLYMAYIKKNLPSTVNVSVDDDDFIVLTNTLAESLNEIGDASAGVFPYNKNRIDTIVDTLKTKIDIQPDAKWQQHLLPFLKFSSPNADYDVITTAQVEKPLNIPDFQTRPNLIDLRVDFTVGESDEATNIGEQYKVMATMTQIIKSLMDKVSKIEGSKLQSVRIFPKSDDGSEEADVNSKRGRLYQAYVKKNLPPGWDMSTGKDARGGSIVLYPPLEEGFNKKLGKDPFGLNAFAYELAKGLEEELDEGRKKKKDPKKGTGKKPKGSGRRLYTDEDPKDTVGVSFRTKEDIVNTLNKKSFKAKSHARQSQVINLIHQRVRAAYGRAKDPETKARLKRGLDYIEKRKEASKAKTQRLKKQKNENVAPNHDGKATPFGSGYKKIDEGRYDSISRQLASITLNAWKSDFKDGAKYGYFEGKITPEEYPTDLTFTFKALGRFVDNKPYNHNGYSRADGEVGVEYTIPKDAIPQIWEEVYMDLISTIRHEVEHQTQGGKNVKKGKGMASDQKLRQLIKKGGGDIVRYVTLPKEIESNVQGLYLKAKKWRRPYDEVVDEYIKDFLKITNPADVSYVKNKWQEAASKRNLPKLLNEGRYDKFVNYLSRIAFEAIKDGFESGRKVLDVIFTVRHPDEEPDIESDMFEFDFQVVADYTQDVYKVNGGANEGIDDDGNEITPLLIIDFDIPKNPKWSTVSIDLKDVVRHELEHLTQSGDNVVGVVRNPDKPELDRPGKQMADDSLIRKMIDNDMLPKAEYFKLEKEVDAMMQGLYFKAKKSRRPFKDVIDDYLATQPISKEEKEVILNLWRSRNKALNLPIFEDEKMPKSSSDLFTIYLDMDGVIVDFDKQFEEQFGMPPREFENNFGTDKFWEKIDSKGVGFWRGMDWMPGGQQLYNRVSQYNHFLLSSPSRSEKSKIGKRLWRRDNTPDTKLILSRSYNKKNYADKSNILIDDRADNIQQWKDAGGIGILYQSADQVMKELDKLGL